MEYSSINTVSHVYLLPEKATDKCEFIESLPS